MKQKNAPGISDIKTLSVPEATTLPSSVSKVQSLPDIDVLRWLLKDIIKVIFNEFYYFQKKSNLISFTFSSSYKLNLDILNSLSFTVKMSHFKERDVFYFQEFRTEDVTSSPVTSSPSQVPTTISTTEAATFTTTTQTEATTTSTTTITTTTVTALRTTLSIEDRIAKMFPKMKTKVLEPEEAAKASKATSKPKFVGNIKSWVTIKPKLSTTTTPYVKYPAVKKAAVSFVW